jgi:hypothetical protein
MGFVVNKVVLGQDILRVLRFYLISTIYQYPMLFLHLQAAGPKDKLEKPVLEIRNMRQKVLSFRVCSQNFNGKCIDQVIERHPPKDVVVL